MRASIGHSLSALALGIVCALLPLAASADATIVINNLNAPGVGFNDPTPVAPVGGNTGTTLGEQRLISFSHAANIWGSTLDSAVPITINAQFRPLTCTATGAVLDEHHDGCDGERSPVRREEPSDTQTTRRHVRQDGTWRSTFVNRHSAWTRRAKRRGFSL